MNPKCHYFVKHFEQIKLNTESSLFKPKRMNTNFRLKIWRVETGDVEQTIAHSGPVTCIEYSADSEFTVTGSEDMSLKVWESATGKLTQVGSCKIKETYHIKQ